INHAGAKPDQELAGRTLADLVMQPTRIYVKSVLAALAKHGESIKGLAHITGGGLLENIPRILKDGVCANIQRDAWELPKLFKWLQTNGNVADQEMARVFNCGIGMVLVVAADQAKDIIASFEQSGETLYQIG